MGERFLMKKGFIFCLFNNCLMSACCSQAEMRSGLRRTGELTSPKLVAFSHNLRTFFCLAPSGASKDLKIHTAVYTHTVVAPKTCKHTLMIVSL